MSRYYLHRVNHYVSTYASNNKLIAISSYRHLKSRSCCEQLKPNSITLAGSKLVRSWSATSFEPASVMEFGLYRMSAWLKCVSRQPVEPRGCRQKCDANVSPRTHPVTHLAPGQSTDTDTITHVPPSTSVLHDLQRRMRSQATLMRCTVMSMSVSVCLSDWLSVCRRGYLRNHTHNLYQIFCACCLCPWLGPPPAY